MPVKQKRPEPGYTLGLDIGIASVGWCLVGTGRIIDLGVRAFDKAETEKGEPLNAERREKRLSRRRLRRRAIRLLRARRLFKREGLIPEATAECLNTPAEAGTAGSWELRAAGLDRKLEPDEWARALYHLIKHRGFRSNRKSEIADDEEAGKLTAAVQSTENLLRASGYRTAAELAVRDPAFAGHKRNKAGDYTHSFARGVLLEELKRLFACQREHGNPHAGTAFEDAVRALFETQRPALTKEGMQKLLGRCAFERNPPEFRAPKRCHSVERFVWLSKLNNLRILENGERRPLHSGERDAALRLPFERKSEKVTYKSLRAALKKACGFPDTARFAGLSYRQEAKNPEEATLMDCQGWHALRKAYENAGLQREWQRLAGDGGRLDAAGHALTVLKTDVEIGECLAANGFSEAEIQALLPIGFRDFIQLSLKALGKLLPHLEQGKRYDEAVREAYGDHSRPRTFEKSRLLPPIDKNEIRNPVVLRALNQARKVVNAIVREYGPPERVHIELARDLSRPWEERDKIRKAQERYRDAKEADIRRFEDEFGFKPRPKDQDLLKWRLYREQDGKCAYSLEPLSPSGDIAEIFRGNRTQIDHILPYSRSFDDSLNNKVLVLTRENQNKANRTPYEYLDGAGDTPNWRRFEGWVRSNGKFREAKRQRLLRKHFGESEAEEFRERNLNDTRYIARYFKNLVENHLQLAESGENQRCVVLSGQLTAFLRARWGLLKNRGESDLHHAMDAAVIAACSHGLVKRLSDWSRRGELEAVRGGYVDPATGEVFDRKILERLEASFPQPWSGFREDLLDRLSPNPRGSGVRPVLVSRAVKRRGGGEIHKAAIASRKAAAGKVKIKVPLQKLTLDKLANAVEPERNRALIAALRTRLAEFGGDAGKAFSVEFRKPSGAGKIAPVVRSIAIWETRLSGVHVRHGIAEMGEMIRVDVYKQGKRYHLVPRYAAKHYFTPVKPPDECAQFCFSLCKNDLMKIEFDHEVTIGYFVMYESDGRLTLRAHDQPRPDKKFFRRSVAGASSITKYHVDILGRYFKIKREERHELAQRDRR